MINDRKLLRLIDAGVTQAEAARRIGVSRQAVSKRLQELRGRQTRVVVSKKIEQAIDRKFDAMSQLAEINRKTLALLDEAEKDADLSLKCISEIRQQIKLAADIYQTMYSVQVVNEFMEAVTETLRDVGPDVYQEFRRRINQNRSLRSSVRFN